MVAAPHKPRRCLPPFPSSFHLISPLDGLLGLQYPSPTSRPTGTTARLERYFHLTWSAMVLQFSMSNQQPTGFPWNSPAGKTPNFGAPSSTPAGGHTNIAPGAAYNLAGAGVAATAAFTSTPPSQGGPTTPTYIAQPGPPYAPTHAGAPTMIANFPNSPVSPVAPVAPAPAPPGATYAPSPLGATYAPSPLGATYAPFPLGATYAPSPLGATYAPSPLGATYAPFPLGATYAPSPLGAAYAPSPGASAHTVHPANAPYIGLATPLTHRGTPTNTRDPNFPLSPPAATSPHKRNHRWHLPQHDFLARAGIPHRRLTPHHRLPLGPQRLDVDRTRWTYLKMYRPHLHRGRFTSPTRSTCPLWTRQASSPRKRSASSTGSSRISADGICPANLRALSTPRWSPRWTRLTTPSSSPKNSGLDSLAYRHRHFQSTNQDVETNLHACERRTNPRSSRRPSTISPRPLPHQKGPLTKRLSYRTNHRQPPGPQTCDSPHSHRPTPRFRLRGHRTRPIQDHRAISAQTITPTP